MGGKKEWEKQITSPGSEGQNKTFTYLILKLRVVFFFFSLRKNKQAESILWVSKSKFLLGHQSSVMQWCLFCGTSLFRHRIPCWTFWKAKIKNIFRCLCVLFCFTTTTTKYIKNPSSFSFKKTGVLQNYFHLLTISKVIGFSRSTLFHL